MICSCLLDCEFFFLFPLGMAYSLLGGVPPVVGIYMAFFPVLLYVLMGTSHHVSMGLQSFVTFVEVIQLQAIIISCRVQFRTLMSSHFGVTIFSPWQCQTFMTVGNIRLPQKFTVYVKLSTIVLFHYHVIRCNRSSLQCHHSTYSFTVKSRAGGVTEVTRIMEVT